MDRLSLRKFYKKHFDGLFSYASVRRLVADNLENLKGIQTMKFNKKTSYWITNEEAFLDSLKQFINVEIKQF
jgi:hypothetical protein